MGEPRIIQASALPERVNLAPRIIAYVGSATLCQMFDISGTTLWEWVRKGHLPRPVKIGVASRWKWADIEKRLSDVKDTDDDPIMRASRGG